MLFLMKMVTTNNQSTGQARLRTRSCALLSPEGTRNQAHRHAPSMLSRLDVCCEMSEDNDRFVGTAAYRGLAIQEFRNAWSEMSAYDSFRPFLI